MTECYVSADVAAAHLSITPRALQDMARAGTIPAHPLRHGRKRHVWRYKISEIDEYMALHHTTFTSRTIPRTNDARQSPGIVPKGK